MKGSHVGKSLLIARGILCAPEGWPVTGWLSRPYHLDDAYLIIMDEGHLG